MDEERAWWKEAVVYQLYPRSFADSDGDGVGDVPGIVERVDYLDDLGVDVVWLTPVYESPQADNGYDISDYHAIDPTYGSMADWERLRDELHDRGMKLIMDIVVNHTSDEHEWFVASRESDGEFADYYWWRDGQPVGPDSDADADSADTDSADTDSADTESPASHQYADAGPDDELPPNNWESSFAESAWAYDETREQWYLHIFDRKQPDLNWELPAVRESVAEILRWWLDKGIDGFRIDTVNLLSKPTDLPDGNPDQFWTGREHFINGPRIQEFVDHLGEVFDDTDAVAVGETPEVSVEQGREFVGSGPLDMVFGFEHILLDLPRSAGHWFGPSEFEMVELKRILSEWQTGMEDGGWNSLYLGNHDWPRMVSRFADDDAYRRESATLLATLLFTLRGTPYVFQGDELGMTNSVFESREDLEDAEALTRLDALIERGTVESFDDVQEGIQFWTRDNARTPMQWSDDEHAGFTDGEPWLAVNPNYTEINVEDQRADPDSVWHYYRELIDLRDDSDLLVYGDYDLLLPADETVWAYTRELDGERALVVLNWSGETVEREWPLVSEVGDPELLVGNYRPASSSPQGDDSLAGSGSVSSANSARQSSSNSARQSSSNSTTASPSPERGLTLRPWEARVYRLD